MRVSVGQARSESSQPEQRADAFIEGEWWPVQHPHLKVQGKVSAFGEGAIWLDADGDPWNSIRSASEEPTVEVHTLYGRAGGGTPMSLHGVRFVGGEAQPLAGRAHTRYVADRFIFGAEASSEDDVWLSLVGTSYRGLREWLLGRTRDTELSWPIVHSEGREEWTRTQKIKIDGVQLQPSVNRGLSSSHQFRTIFDTSA